MELANRNIVCISDLHLGARYSILSSRVRDDKGKLFYNPRQVAPCLSELLTCLREFIPATFDDEQPPTLLILGDLVDYSFGTADDIVHAFKQFIATLFNADEAPLFANDIVFIPGNHDHHLWQSCKDDLFARQFHQFDEQSAESQKFNYHTTPLYQPKPLASTFLNTIARSVNENLSVQVCYPNLALSNADGSREVYLHHGHFVESAYRLVTTINTVMADMDPPSIEQLEQQNGGWIDFFWSSLGDSAVSRDTSTLLFDVMQNPAASQAYAKKLAQMLGDYISRHYSISAHTKVYKHLSLEKLFSGMVDASLGRVFQLERSAFQQSLSDQSLAGLEWYLSTPLLTQIKQQRHAVATELDVDATFIFGHTHKPFYDQLAVEGFKRPLTIINSGGWVVDKPSSASVQGGALVFIDASLNTASLRLFQDPVNDQMQPVRAEGRDSPLLTQLNQQLQAKPQQWQNFQQQVKTAIDQRAAESRAYFFDPHSSTGIK